MSAPSSAKRSATARPMPRCAPVTRTILSRHRMGSLLSRARRARWNRRREPRHCLTASGRLAAPILVASSAMSDITPAIRADLAPTGRLRAGINYGNFILAAKDRATGESRGAAVDLMREVAERLGVPAQIVPYDSVAVMGDAAPTGVWDIAFLGSDPAREALMS